MDNGLSPYGWGFVVVRGGLDMGLAVAYVMRLLVLCSALLSSVLLFSFLRL